MCGGTLEACRADLAAYGLSPRVRGNHRPLAIRTVMQRSIPACAGEPPRPSDDDDGVRVYPRVCGGTLRPAHLRVCRVGLSPRVRGNRIGMMTPGVAGRSIPACAGEP